MEPLWPVLFCITNNESSGFPTAILGLIVNWRKRRVPGLLVSYRVVVLSGKKENLCWNVYALLHIRIQFDIDSSVVKNIVAMQSCNLANWGKCRDETNHHHSIAISDQISYCWARLKGVLWKKSDSENRLKCITHFNSTVASSTLWHRISTSLCFPSSCGMSFTAHFRPLRSFFGEHNTFDLSRSPTFHLIQSRLLRTGCKLT